MAPVRTVSVAVLLACCALLAAANLAETDSQRPDYRLDALAATMLPERDEGHDPFMQRLYHSRNAPSADEKLTPYRPSKSQTPKQKTSKSSIQKAPSAASAPTPSQTSTAPPSSAAASPSRAPAPASSVPAPASAGVAKAFPDEDMTLDENYEQSDLPEMTPAVSLMELEANAQKWISCANLCGGEHAVIRALKSGRKTPRCCVDLLYETTMYVHRLLSRNGVTYWAMKGTLLGVVREKGIIPHDYDIDIGMLHQDINKVASLRRQIEKDGYVLLRAPWTGYNNMNFVILKKTRAVREYFDRNPVGPGERPMFTKELRKISIAAELMVFKKMRGYLVQVLCTAPHPRNPDLYLGAINPDAYEEFRMDLEDFEARRQDEKDGWLKYANQNDKPWVNFFKKFKDGMSPYCEHTAPASFRYDTPAKWVLPPRKMQYYSKRIFAPAHPYKYAGHYFGPDFMTPKRRYGDF